ncbi:MAG: asparagine synthase-related protein [Candidatus Hodarchaeota archaeon]
MFESHGWGIARLDPICSQFSLNSRNPIEDYRMKELAAKIPTYIKQPNESQDKYIWRKTIRKYDLLPEKVLNQNKMGFGINPVISQWFKGELKEYVHQTILDGLPSMRHIINEKAVEKVVDKGTTPQKYSLLMFTLWYENFFLN